MLCTKRDLFLVQRGLATMTITTRWLMAVMIVIGFKFPVNARTAFSATEGRFVEQFGGGGAGR